MISTNNNNVILKQLLFVTLCSFSVCLSGSSNVLVTHDPNTPETVPFHDFRGRPAYDWVHYSSPSDYVFENRSRFSNSHYENASEYDKCKATRRCPSYTRTEYAVEDARYTYFKRAFEGGRWDPVDIFLDFEEWKAGTHGFTSERDFESQQLNGPNIESSNVFDADLNSFDFELLGEIDFSNSTNLIFNTDDATLTINNEEIRNGVITLVESTQVAVFNFKYVRLERDVSIQVIGNRALVILSRSSIRFDTNMTLEPGTTGGFKGIASNKTVNNWFLPNNKNGPGCPSVRVYTYTLRTTAEDVDEIQTITTTANPGQQLGGTFRIKLNDVLTPWMPHDIKAHALRLQLETLENIGKVSVKRTLNGDTGGYHWKVRFRQSVGNITEMIPESRLTGHGASVGVRTDRHGNHLSGTFRIGFLNRTTRDLNHDISASELGDALVEDIDEIESAVVSRLDPHDLQRCRVGLCAHGPSPGFGYRWLITVTTLLGNVEPTSPTASNIDMVGSFTNLTIVEDLLEGTNASVEIVTGHSDNIDRTSLHSITQDYVFSLSYGGGGGGHGGRGGVGTSSTASLSAGKTYVCFKALLFVVLSLRIISLTHSTPSLSLTHVHTHTHNTHHTDTVQDESTDFLGEVRVLQVVTRFEVLWDIPT